MPKNNKKPTINKTITGIRYGERWGEPFDMGRSIPKQTGTLRGQSQPGMGQNQAMEVSLSITEIRASEKSIALIRVAWVGSDPAPREHGSACPG